MELYSEYVKQKSNWTISVGNNWFVCYKFIPFKRLLIVTELFARKNHYRFAIKNIYSNAIANDAKYILGKVEKSNLNYELVCKLHSKIGMIPYNEDAKNKYFFIKPQKLEIYQ